MLYKQERLVLFEMECVGESQEYVRASDHCCRRLKRSFLTGATMEKDYFSVLPPLGLEIGCFINCRWIKRFNVVLLICFVHGIYNPSTEEIFFCKTHLVSTDTGRIFLVLN
jgi:hypothetical protein